MPRELATKPVLRSVEDAPESAAPAVRPRGSWRDLLWSEWFAHSRLLLFCLLGWLLVAWVLPLFTHPLWILAYGVGFALVAGPAFGGADVIEGCEEFMLAQPTPRGARFVVRMCAGLGALLAFTGMSMLGLGLNLADALARVFLSTGLIRPVQLSQPGLLYGLVAAFPLAIFALGFAVAALARTRTVAFTSWLWGTLGALSLLRVGLHAEEAVWDRFNGRLTMPLLVLASTFVLWVAWRLYRRKEPGVESAPLHIPPSWWGWLLALLLGAAGIATLLGWFAENFVRLL